MADTFLPRTERQAASQKFVLIEMRLKRYRNLAPLPEKSSSKKVAANLFILQAAAPVTIFPNVTRAA